MKKILSKEEHEKKKRRNSLIVGGVLVFLMLFSTLGYAFSSKSSDNTALSKTKYHGISFLNNGDFWIGQTADYQIYLKNKPTEGNSSEIAKQVLDYSGKPLYLVSQEYVAENLVMINLGAGGANNIALRTQRACFENMPCEIDAPIKTCEDNLIIIANATTPSITEDKNCVFIKGPEENLTQLTDEFVLNVFGI